MGGPERDINQDERDLIIALRAGEPSAFARLHSRYLNRVFGYVVRHVPQHEEAEDITCEVFAAALKSFPSFRGQASLFVWLIGIARRKIADHLRRVRRHALREADLPSGQPSPLTRVDWTQELPEELLHRQEVIEAVRRAVSLLPEAQRESLLLHHVEGLSIRDISRLMTRSEDSIKGLIRRAKATLLGMLAPLGEEASPDRLERRPAPSMACNCSRQDVCASDEK